MSIKTGPTDADVTAFLDAVSDPRRCIEGHAMRELFERVTGAPAVMWGPSMVGFGSRPYSNSTGTNDMFVIGFAPRRAALTFYGIHDGDDATAALLDQLGPHTTSSGCLYVKRLDRIDLGVLEQLVRVAWDGSQR